MTARGAVPCCAIKKLSKIFSRVIRQFDGLGRVNLDRVVCPGCVISQRSAGTSCVTPSPPHCFNVHSLRHDAQRKSSSSPSSAAAAVNGASEQRSAAYNLTHFSYFIHHSSSLVSNLALPWCNPRVHETSCRSDMTFTITISAVTLRYLLNCTG